MSTKQIRAGGYYVGSGGIVRRISRVEPHHFPHSHVYYYTEDGRKEHHCLLQTFARWAKYQTTIPTDD